MIQVETLWPLGATLGEGPLWSGAEQALYFVDIKGPALHRWRDGERTSWPLTEALTSLAFTPTGGLVGSARGRVVRISLGQDAVLEEIARPAPWADRLRFNDGKVAPDGAYWIGSMDDEESEVLGGWWRLSADGALAQVDRAVMVANGPAFDPARRRTYLTDSAARTIFVCDGWGADAPSTKRPFRTFSDGDGYPDGMALDAEGGLWVAFWDGGCVRRLDPAFGETLLQIDLPVRRPTSLAFCGPGLDQLFVTSAGIGSPAGGADGALLRITGHGANGPLEPFWSGE